MRMETWQMIKELTENSERKFKTMATEKCKSIIASTHDGFIRYQNMKGHTVSDIRVDMDWEEDIEPVDFMTAVKSGKRIRVEHPYLEGKCYADGSCAEELFTYNSNSLDCLLHALGNFYDEKSVREIIVNGKWYIED